LQVGEHREHSAVVVGRGREFEFREGAFSLLVATNDPAGTAARVASFIPPVTPMVVPLRAALGAIQPWR
jgi:hypothetical protein